MRYAYFPGCSLEGANREFDLSIRTVCGDLGIELAEVEDWCCCGSTPAHMTNELLSVALPIENALWAQEQGLDLTMACAACFSAFKTADYRMKAEPAVKEKVEQVLEAPYGGTIAIKHILDVMVNDLGLDRVRESVQVPLEGLKAAAYYGCLLTRPPKVKAFDDPEDPQALDHLIRALGGEPVAWTHKTVCCGASFSATDPNTALKLSGDLLRQAKRAGAECMVVACPLCHSNLDMNQEDIWKRYGEDLKMPVFYFSQLMGVAMGVPPRQIGLDKNVVEPWALLSRYIVVDEREYR